EKLVKVQRSPLNQNENGNAILVAIEFPGGFLPEDKILEYHSGYHYDCELQFYDVKGFDKPCPPDKRRISIRIVAESLSAAMKKWNCLRLQIRRQFDDRQAIIDHAIFEENHCPTCGSIIKFIHEGWGQL